jgi:cation transport protein ChaC
LITRDRILGGEVEQRLQEAERQGLLTRLPEADRIAARDNALAAMPDDSIWVFAYGSLIWNPAFHFVQQSKGRIHGWRRSFCLETPMGRGSPDCTGLVLGLDRGGSCQGLAFRLEAKDAVQELDIVFRRELVSDAYQARIVTVHTEDGPHPAVTFVMNRKSPRYCGHLTIEEVAGKIAEAEGWLGPCSDYLFNTVDHMRELGLNDHGLFWLENRVKMLQAAR